MIKTPKKLSLLILIILLSCHGSSHLVYNDNRDQGLIDPVTDIISYLSSPELDGRLSGSEGYNLAADFIAQQFSEIKLLPITDRLGETVYRQYFTIEYNQIIAPSSFDLVDSASITTEYILNKDYLFRGFTGSGDFVAPVTFCGYGISAPENGYDDYESVDLRNKVALMFKEVPTWPSPNVNWQEYNFPRVKAKMAANHGAVGVLFVSHPEAWLPGIFGSVAHGPADYLPKIPQLHVTASVADDLFQFNEHTLESVRTLIDSLHSPISFDLNRTVRIIANNNYRRDGTTSNVIGKLPGSDRTLTHEYLVVGAHLDHVGRQSRDVYFPGANDNASGVACMLQIAQKLIQQREQLYRSIIFIAFAGEESGLEGSTYFMKNSIIDPQQIKAMINLDCVGRGDSIRVHGGQNNPEFYALLKKHGTDYNLLSRKSGKGGGADAQPFHEANIPTFYFVTTNGYQHLHKSTDTVETIDTSLILEVAALATEFITSLAQYDMR